MPLSVVSVADWPRCARNIARRNLWRCVVPPLVIHPSQGQSFIGPQRVERLRRIRRRSILRKNVRNLRIFLRTIAYKRIEDVPTPKFASSF